MALEDKAYEAVASSTTVSERDDRHSEAFSMFNTKALDGNRRGGHLLSSLWAFGGVTCGRGGKGGQRAVTRALGLTWIPGATTAALRSGSRAKGVTGGVGLDVTSWGFELEIKIKRRWPLRTMEGAPGATSWAFQAAVGGSLGNLVGTQRSRKVGR